MAYPELGAGEGEAHDHFAYDADCECGWHEEATAAFRALSNTRTALRILLREAANFSGDRSVTESALTDAMIAARRLLPEIAC